MDRSKKQVLLETANLPIRGRRRPFPVVYDGGSVRDVLLNLTKPLHKLPFIGKRIKFTLQGPRKVPPKRVLDFMNSRSGGDQAIIKLEVSQKPIDNQGFLNAISLGRFNEVKKKYGYDNAYHRFLLATMQDGKIYVVEKNHVVSIRPAKADDLKYPKHQIPLPTNRLLSLKEMFDNAINTDAGKPATQQSKERLIQYSASLANCQNFVKEMIEDNGLTPTDPETLKAIEPQNSVALVDAFGALAPLADLITDTASTLDRTKHGDGLTLISTGDEKLLSGVSKMTQYHSYALKFSDAQLKRLAEGLTVRLKHDDLSPGEGEGIPVCLTKTQINKVKKSIASGKGMQLQFSQTQLEACMSEHHNKVGAGVFSDALKRIGRLAGSAYRGVKSVVKNPTAQKLARSLAGSIGERYGSTAVDLATGVAGKAIKEHVPDVLKPFVDTGMELGSRLTKQQLDGLIKGIKSGSGLYKAGKGLHLPGSRPAPRA